MTFWAKLLTIILFVLSIAFAAMSGVIFAKRQDYRSKLVEEQQTNAETQKRLRDRVAALKNERDQKKAELAQAGDTIRAMDTEIARLTADVAKKDADAQELKSDMAALKDMQAKLVDDNSELTERNLRISENNDALAADKRDLIAKLETERNRSNNLSKEKADLITERDNLKVSLNKAHQAIARYEEILAEAARHNVVVQRLVDDILVQPDIRGKVAWADQESNLVVLNIGRNDGVRKNHFFTVFRDGDFVARVNVFELYEDNFSAARVVTSKRPIQAGDDAWSRVY